MKDEQHDLLALIQQNAWEIQDAVTRILALEGPTEPWAFPVGTEKYPPNMWYAATVHDETGRLNGNYPHTGIDLNLDLSPWGDVDRGMPVWNVASGIVELIGYSQSYLGSIIVRIEHAGASLYVRYWHLADDAVFRSIGVGQVIRAGQRVGSIGNYTLGAGGDHCHLDVRDRPYPNPHAWFTKHPGGWLDPVPPLRAHLNPAMVDAMLKRNA